MSSKLITTPLDSSFSLIHPELSYTFRCLALIVNTINNTFHNVIVPFKVSYN